MIERKRGHIVATCSVGGLTGIVEGIFYSTTKFAVRGLMESLALQLYFDDQSDFIKTTTVFPSFVDTRPCVKIVVEKGTRGEKLYSGEECGQAIVTGILKEKEIVTIPWTVYYLFYLT